MMVVPVAELRKEIRRNRGSNLVGKGEAGVGGLGIVCRV
jgi:hypothetical protein